MITEKHNKNKFNNIQIMTYFLFKFLNSMVVYFLILLNRNQPTLSPI